MSTPAAEPARGRSQRRIGKYVITGRIGRGGMGIVYRGRDERLERDVAVKTLTVEGTLDDESRARFEIEAKAAARLQHPNIVTIFELGQDRGLPFIAMELLPGVDLETLLRSGEPLLLEEQLDVVVQAARALAFAHEHGVVHRDMKPSNIRVLDDGRVKILDFGIAKLGQTAVTKSGMMVGTVHYMSPEQIRGVPLDGRSDVFSLGVILYELLAGERPFPGQEATQILYRIVHEPPPPLRGDWGALTPRLVALVERALAKDPAARYSGAARLADELADILAALRSERAAQCAPVDLDALARAQRLATEGRPQEGLERLRELVARHPAAVEPRRALRTAERAWLPTSPSPDPGWDDEPAVAAPTLQADTTLRGTTTLAEAASAGRAPGAAAVPARTPRTLAAGLAVTLLLALVGYLSWRSAGAGPQRLTVRSDPPGARVLLDGRDTGVLTEGEVDLPRNAERVRLTLRKPGYAEAVQELASPFPQAPLRLVLTPVGVGQVLPPASSPGPGRALAELSVSSEPEGARVLLDGLEQGRTPLRLRYDPHSAHRLTLSLEGHESFEQALAPGRVPESVRAQLVPRGPGGSVLVSSRYPLDVLWQGRVLAKGQEAPRVSLPAGKQTLTLVAPQYFLKSTVSVQVRADVETALEAPGLGRLNVRATPDNCEVLINGVFADYPPILDKPVAAGSLTVTFKWPDGTRRDESLTLAAGAIEYVTGRKE